MSYIPRPPRVSPKNPSGSGHFEEVDWTAEQVDFTLRMIINKIISGDHEGITIGHDASIYNDFTIKMTSKIYVSLRSDYVFMILDNHASGSFQPSGLFWKDRSVKSTMKELLSALNNKADFERKRLEKENNKYKTEVATAALWNAFPDALNAEFEKHVLGEQNVESKDEES